MARLQRRGAARRGRRRSREPLSFALRQDPAGVTADTLLPPCRMEQPSRVVPLAEDIYLLRQPLSVRQMEIMRLVAEGIGNKEIGARLQVSPQTVKNHMNDIMRRLGAQSRTHAAMLLFGCYEANCPRLRQSQADIEHTFDEG